MPIIAQKMTTQTGASVAATASSILDAVKALINQHANWSVVEDNASVGTGPWRYLAVKCAAASSGAPSDVYVLFTSGPAGQVTAQVGEAYSTSSHTISACPAGYANGYNSTFALDSQARVAAPFSYSPAADGTPSGSGTLTGYSQRVVLDTAATTLYYQCYIYNDHLVFGISGTSAAASGVSTYYFGGYTSYIPTPATNDPFQIVGYNLGTGSSTYDAVGQFANFTRDPLPYASSTRYLPLSCSHMNNNSAWPASNQIPVDNPRSLATGVDPLTGLYPAGRVLLITTSNKNGAGNQFAASGAAYFALRGLLNNAIYSVPAGSISGIAVGDTILYNGTYWAFCGNAHFVDTGATS